MIKYIKIIKKLLYDINIKKLPYGKYSTFINPFAVSKQFPPYKVSGQFPNIFGHTSPTILKTIPRHFFSMSYNLLLIITINDHEKLELFNISDIFPLKFGTNSQTCTDREFTKIYDSW